MMRKLKSMDVLFWVVIIFIAILGVFLPKSGEWVMADEFVNILFVWGVCVAIIVWIKRMGKAKDFAQKAWRIGAIIVGLCISLFFGGRFLIDMVKGTQYITLYDVEVSKYQGRYGVFSSHYYIQGNDVNGKRQRFEISADDYSELLGEHDVTVEYYRYSDRVKDIQ